MSARKGGLRQCRHFSDKRERDHFFAILCYFYGRHLNIVTLHRKRIKVKTNVANNHGNE